jgi:transposase
MYIDCVTNSGKPYLRVAESYSVREGGALKNRKRTIRNLGPLARFDDGKPDFLARLRRSFAEGAPLIESLADLTAAVPPPHKLTVVFDRTDADEAYANPKNCGYFLLDALYDALGIYDVLNLHKSRAALDFDLNGAAKLLTFGRALSPDSKLGTFENRENYLFPVAADNLRLADMYTALGCLNDKSEAIQKRMNAKIRQSVGRDTEVCFYDVTNYYFEIGENDADTLDENGAVIRSGLRKKGVSKEKRGEPIVQMGLFTDDNGIPISYQLFPGNRLDQTTLRPAMKKTIGSMDFGRVIIVADGGLNSGQNIAHILDGGNGYIVAKSTKKSDKTAKAWILEQDGYRWNDAKTFKVKSQIRTRKIKAEDGSFREITEKLVCFWSKKHYDRERHENEKFIEYLESVIEFPDKLKDRSRKIEQFLEKAQIDKRTGEVVKTATSLSLDMDKIQEYLDLMGYYTIMTSEIDKPDEEIISKYHGLSRIEDSFRITKSDLEGRPVFVRTPEHIDAHFLTCFIALAMIRLIQHKILKYQGKPTNSTEKWETGLSAERIQTALSEWKADPLPGGYYRLTKPTADLELILTALGITADCRLPTVKDLRDLKYLFDKAV